MKRGAFSKLRFHLNAAAVKLDVVLHDGQPKPGALFLGGEIGFENLRT